MLYLNFIILSLSLVSANYASYHPLFSFPAASFYGLSFILLGGFSIVWQQILKHIPLTIAYTNRSITILLGMVWGALLFAEKITWNMILGCVIIMTGVVMMGVRRE